MSGTSRVRRAAGLAAVAVTTVAVSVGGVASPAQTVFPSASCGYVLRMHDVHLQKASTAAYVSAPSMIWAATASSGWHEAVWYYYWENMQAAGDWTDIATQLGC
jgi:hypothetical protein